LQKETKNKEDFTMKKLLSLFTAAVLVLGISYVAQAGAANTDRYNVQDIQGQAVTGWHQTYQTHGRTVVVDIPIQVPDVAAFPALRAEPMPALNGIPITDFRGYSQENSKFFNEAGSFRWDSIAGELMTEAARKSGKSSSNVTEIEPVVRFFNQLEWDTAYALNTPSTVRDADALMKATCEKYFPNEKIDFLPHWVNVYGDPQAPLMVYFDQVMRGIPLLCYSMNSFSHYSVTLKQESRGYVGGIAIMQGLTDIGLEDTFYSMQYSLLKEQQEIESDIPLCSLSKAIDTYEQLIEEGKLRSVQSLRLGYVVWYDKGDKESYTMLPTWVLEGDLFKEADEERQRPLISNEKSGEYGPILVNAQTGELIDPWNSSPDRSYDKPDILSWK
jgi:hypothetical protein